MGNAKVFIKSFGCSTNMADGEVMAGCLAEAGYVLVRNLAEADVVIYNTCAVKGPTEDRMISISKKTPHGKKLVIAGCLPLINYDRLCREVPFNGVAGPALGEKIVNVVEGVLKGERILALEGAEETKPRLDLPRVRLNPVVGIIPICYGCLGSCTYCCVIFARGRLRSYSVSEIVERVKMDISDGVKEIWLTAQDTACYGRDIGTNLAELLKAVCNVDSDFKVRVGMMTPNSALNIINDLVEVFKNTKIFKFVHLPVQSGDDEILRAMGRFYSIEDYKRIVNLFRAEIPEITLATDVICGFPGEDEKAFERTLYLIREIKPDIVNISRFFARPGTPAAKMPNRLPQSVVNDRGLKLTHLTKEISLERNSGWVGWEGEVLVDEVGTVKDTWIGRNYVYKPVVIKACGNLLGKFLKVRVTGFSSACLKGEPLNFI